jgi:23S rRNA A1618 N6-methylase RlmF
MNRMSIPALVLALSLPNAVYSQSAENSELQKLQEFNTAKSRLEANIIGFVESIKVCQPPFGDKIVDGFAGANNKQSALSLLNVQQKNVNNHVAEAKVKMDALAGANLSGVNICKGGSEAFEAQVVVPADAVAKDAVAKLQGDLDDYRKGYKVALENEGMVRKAVQLRRTVQLTSGGDTKACDRALAHLEEQGKHTLKESDRNLQNSLVALQKTYTDRVVAVKAYGKKFAQCPSTASIPAVRGQEARFEVADVEQEGASSAQ